MAGTINMNTNIITNIGNAGTDFVAGTGGLTLAGVLTANVAAEAQAITIDAATIDNTGVNGVLRLDLDSVGDFVDVGDSTDYVKGLFIDAELIDDATTSQRVSAVYIKLDNKENFIGDVIYGIKMEAAATSVNTSAISFMDLQNLDAGSMQKGIVIAGSPGAITDAIDVSDAEIINAINVGDNIILGTTATIDFTNFDVASTGIVSPNWSGTATTNGVCHSGTDLDAGSNVQRDLVVCSAAPGDIAEWYETREDVEPGDLVAISQDLFEYQSVQVNPLTGELLPEKAKNTIAVIEKTTKPYQQSLFGIISTSPYQTFGRSVIEYASHPLSVSLIGRVPLKVSTENGPIEPGDPLTSSSTPGVAMSACAQGFGGSPEASGEGGKATYQCRSGPIIGKALEPFDGAQGDIGRIMVFVSVG
jgi:hypothetical protein